nr:MAG TPA: hypothetical protein [Caudoviricetes sp.]
MNKCQLCQKLSRHDFHRHKNFRVYQTKCNM